MSALVLAVANAKGGTGKTGVVCHTSGALSGRSRVCVVDLDPQGDLTAVLGIRPHDPRFDDGAQLLKSLTTGAPLEPVPARWVEPGDDGLIFERERLSIVPGGERVEEFVVHALSETVTGDELHRALEPLRDQFDWILLDCPPGNRPILRQALRAADWFVVPVSDDFNELRGLDRLVRTALDTGGRARLLGAVLSHMPAGAKGALRELVETAEMILGESAGLLLPPIRESVEYGRAGELGLTLSEYARWLQGTAGFTASRQARRVAYDYDELSDSIEGALRQRGAL